MTMEAGRAVFLLPGGYLDAEGVLHREAELVPLSGREEEMLADLRETAAPLLVTRVLGRCVRRIGSIRPVPEPVIRRLLIADRQYLLLRLREITFGSRVEGTISCPWPGCGARVDLDFSTTDVPVKRCEEVAATYRVELSADAAVEDPAGSPRRTLRFRLPRGEDQELLAPVLARNPAEALTGLLARCVAVEEEDGEGVELVARLSARARLELERAMEVRAPHLDLEMALACPECGRGFTAPFDLQDFFFGELRTSRDLLYRQVHYLAYHYHWSEREIMEMPRERRLAYIEVLAEEIEALNHVH